MIPLVKFSPSGQLVTQEVSEADLLQVVHSVYQPSLDSYIVGIAGYVENWADESKNAVKNRLMNYDLWIALKNRLQPYANTLNAINSYAARSFKQQDAIDRLRADIKNVSAQSIPEQSASVWDMLGISKSTPVDIALAPLEALRSTAAAIKNGFSSLGGKVIDRASATATKVALAYAQTGAGKKLISDAASQAGMSAADYLTTPEGKKLIQDALGDTGVKKLVKVLTVGSVVALGSLAIWLLTRSRK